MKLHQIEPIISDIFKDDELIKAVDVFLERSHYSEKWLLYSDYCLDDKDKPNDVVTFALVPFLDEDSFQNLDNSIASTQSKDLKKSKDVNLDFLKLLREYPIFSFSFILEDRKILFGDSGDERVTAVSFFLEQIKANFESWIKNAEEGSEVINYYQDSVKIINTQLLRVKQKKDTKLISDIILIALLGTIYSSIILKRLPKLSIIGWFPDRDKTNEGCDNIIVPIYNTLFYNKINDRFVKWAVTDPNTTKIPFYDNENRIVDFICGTIADYDFKKNSISKDKFQTVLKELISDNSNIRIYGIHSLADPLTISIYSLESEKDTE